MANRSTSFSSSSGLRNYSRSLFSIITAFAVIFVMSIFLRVRYFPPNFHRLFGTVAPSMERKTVKLILHPQHKSMLRLNTDIDNSMACPKVLVLRTPKTASSSLAAIFFLKRVALGRRCAKLFFPAGIYLPKGQYTITAGHVNETTTLNHAVFVAHMNYTPHLRRKLHVNRLFRISTLRKPSSRAHSLLSYEENRPHIRLRPALEYLGAPRLYQPNKYKYDEISENFTAEEVTRQVNAVLKHWHLILISEYWDISLTLVMYHLKWRFVDILAPSLNVQDTARKSRALKRISLKRTREEKNHLKWTVKIDTLLYEKSTWKLRHKFNKLPMEYRKIPAYLKLYRPLLTKRCSILPHQKQLTRKNMRCIRDYRIDLLKSADVSPANA